MSLKQNYQEAPMTHPGNEIGKKKVLREKRIHADVPESQHRAFLIQLIREGFQMKEVLAVLAEFYVQDEKLRARVRRKLQA